MDPRRNRRIQSTMDYINNVRSAGDQSGDGEDDEAVGLTKRILLDGFQGVYQGFKASN